MPKKNLALIEAKNFLSSLINDPALITRGCLPSIREMAKLAGCSHFTMWKAIKAVEKKGRLKVVHGRRIKLISEQDGKNVAAEQERIIREAADFTFTKWEKLEAEIEQDIFRGAFSNRESMPSLKELQARYAVSYKTLKKALQSLQDKRIISHTLKLQNVWPEPVGSKPMVSLAYFYWGDDKGNIKFTTPFDHEILNILENECTNANINLEKISYFYKRKKLMFCHHKEVTSSLPEICQEAYGVFMRTVCSRDVIPDLLPQMAALDKKISVMDEMGSPHLASMSALPENVQIFNHTISDTATKQLGMYLCGLGHTKVAFFSPWKTVWAQNRHRGLVETYRKMGHNNAVSTFAIDLDYQLPSEEKEHSAVTVLKEAFSEASEKWNPEFPSLSVIKRRLKPLLKGEIWREYTLEKLKPLLDKALSDPSITAWVGVDDDTALILLDYLKWKKIHLPEDLSLVGIDDNEESAQNNLTTYNFNFSHFIYTMLMYILYPSRKRSRVRIPMEMKGRIVERGTTRKLY
ncbi:GntR family transcriptional regulator [Fibrobacterota bacterium]